MNPHVIVIDNRDSFTFNLVHDLEALGATVEVYRNHVPLHFLLARATALQASFLLSPGPGAPGDAGVCVDLVQAATGHFGVLGICLGHQAIVAACGGRVGPARAVMHGRVSTIRSAEHALFDGLPRTLRVARYHSLAALALPNALEAIAFTADETVMAVAHRGARVAGLQFHPESILTCDGRKLLANALAWLNTRSKTAKEKRNAAPA